MKSERLKENISYLEKSLMAYIEKWTKLTEEEKQKFEQTKEKLMQGQKELADFLEDKAKLEL